MLGTVDNKAGGVVQPSLPINCGRVVPPERGELGPGDVRTGVLMCVELPGGGRGSVTLGDPIRFPVVDSTTSRLSLPEDSD